MGCGPREWGVVFGFIALRRAGASSKTASGSRLSLWIPSVGEVVEHRVRRKFDRTLS